MGCLNSQDKSLKKENQDLKLKLTLVQSRLTSLSTLYEVMKTDFAHLNDCQKALKIKYKYLKGEQEAHTREPSYNWNMDTICPEVKSRSDSI